MLGKIEGRKRRERERRRWLAGWYHRLDGHESEQSPGVGDREAWHAAVHRVAKSRT